MPCFFLKIPKIFGEGVFREPGWKSQFLKKLFKVQVMKFLLVWFFRPLSTPGGYQWSPKLTRSNFFFFHVSESKNFFFKLFLIKKKWGLLVDKSKLYGYRGSGNGQKKKKKKKIIFDSDDLQLNALKIFVG